MPKLVKFDSNYTLKVKLFYFSPQKLFRVKPCFVFIKFAFYIHFIFFFCSIEFFLKMNLTRERISNYRTQTPVKAVRVMQKKKKINKRLLILRRFDKTESVKRLLWGILLIDNVVIHWSFGALFLLKLSSYKQCLICQKSINDCKVAFGWLKIYNIYLYIKKMCCYYW